LRHAWPQIKAQIEETTSDYDREKLQERLAKLAGGGRGDPRRRRRPKSKSRSARIAFDDAMHATRAAVEEGIGTGGGVACCVLPSILKGIRTKNDDQRTGVEIVRKALCLGRRAVRSRSPRGEDGSVIVGKILEKDQYAYGFDSQTGEYGNLITKGIIDPTKGGARGDPECGLCRGSPDHHRSHGGRTAEEERSGRRQCLRAAAWAAWTSDPSVQAVSRMQNPGSDAGVFVWVDRKQVLTWASCLPTPRQLLKTTARPVDHGACCGIALEVVLHQQPDVAADAASSVARRRRSASNPSHEGSGRMPIA